MAKNLPLTAQPDLTTFAGRLEQLRRDRRMSVLAFAKFCGVRNSTMRDYLAGAVSPKLDAIQKILSATGARDTWLLHGERAPEAKLTSREFRKLLAAKHTVGAAVVKLATKHRDPAGLINAWSHISLWLEDNA